MLSALTNILTCPVCKNGVTVEGGTLCCLGGKHRFDLAREGYVNLAVGHAPGGDSKQAIAARTSSRCVCIGKGGARLSACRCDLD
jgi:hypothetical protein